MLNSDSFIKITEVRRLKNKDLYIDEFGQYHEVEEVNEEDTLDEESIDEDELDLFDLADENTEEFEDEDEEYANTYNSKYDSEYETEFDDDN